MQIFIKEKVERKILDKQFEIIGVDLNFEKLEEVITVGKKKVPWIEVYKFKDKEQYEEWKKWAKEELQKNGLNNFDKLDMLYGLHYRL